MPAPRTEFDCYAAAVRFHDLAHDREPEAAIARGAGARGVTPVEAIEDVGQVLSSYARAGIPYLYPGRVSLGAALSFTSPPFGV